MLKKIFRLPKTKLNKAQTFTLQNVVLKVSENGIGAKRFGFVVSKKIDKRAVVRNKTKRILRTFVQERLDKIKSGYDFLFIAKSSVENNSKLEELLKKEGYLK